MLTAEIKDALAAVECAELIFDEPLSRHTTLKMGGPADVWVAPETVKKAQAICGIAAKYKTPIQSVGGGSNLLVRDKGVRGIVLSSRQLRRIEKKDSHGIYVQSGVSTGKLLSKALEWELGDLEFLGGVPGTVGGGLKMNAGTYLGEFVDVTETVRSLVLSTGEMVERSKKECGFRYRGSDLPTTEWIVDAELHCPHRPKEAMKETIRSLRERRKEREPHKVSNAGSVFKNPEGDYAGRLLEEAGFKGKSVGNAMCSPVHANWFVNTGGATTKDMLKLIAMAREEIKNKFDVDLLLEWKVIGEE